MFRADLHIHSRFALATSSKLTVPHLSVWAGIKGINVLATGDFTHPVWRAELQEFLEEDSNTGLLRLKNSLTKEDIAREIPAASDITLSEPKFMLEAEISSIYKKNGKTRKIHNLVYMPDFESAEKFCCKLGEIGNLHSDGRPIIGLDSKNLLEMVLEFPGAYLIPAHIWTPWFALFGSKSGFDSLEECFEDLSPYIFAAETGLSSDPDMNRCWSHLDRICMVSNSDAHSGEKIARESTLFSGDCTYDGIFDTLHNKPSSTQFNGTLEFFPEEGKYHLDGHRECGIVLEPEECIKLNNICPVCGRPLTVGVLHRVLALADRSAPPEPGKNFSSLIPLPEILAEILHSSAQAQKTRAEYYKLVGKFGSEMDILQNTALSDLYAYSSELGEAIKRMRIGKVIKHPGFDGQFGIIRLFEKEENQVSLLKKIPEARRTPLPSCKNSDTEAEGRLKLTEERRTIINNKDIKISKSTQLSDTTNSRKEKNRKDPLLILESYSDAQRQAIAAGPQPVMVIAGPGSGKTRTLIGRIISLIKSGIPASEIAAVTFTRRAAEEMRLRLQAALNLSKDQLPVMDTLHALALKNLQGECPAILSEESANKLFFLANPSLEEREANTIFIRLSRGRELMIIPDDILPFSEAYKKKKNMNNAVDYTDLLELWLNQIKSEKQKFGIGPFKQHLLVDEIQDLSPLQTELIRSLLPADGAGFFGIGDPDQSIYGFRGADSHIRETLSRLWSTLNVFSLTESYRSAADILKAGQDSLQGKKTCEDLLSVTGTRATLQWMSVPNGEREASWIASRISELIGGTSHLQADHSHFINNCHLEPGSCSPGDIAVLCRIKALIPLIKSAMERKGIPCAAPEEEAFWKDDQVELLLQAATRHENSLKEKKLAIFADSEKFPLLTGIHSSTYGVGIKNVLDNIPDELWEQGPEEIVRNRPEAFEMLFKESSAFKRLCRSWNQYKTWKGLLEFVNFRQEADMIREHSEFVQIMTVHSAKGLEFKAVFIPGMEEGIFPFLGVKIFPKSKKSFYPVDYEEEKRLLYVGITRASEAVFLTSAYNRTLYGEKLQLPASSILPVQDFKADSLKLHIVKKESQLSLL